MDMRSTLRALEVDVRKGKYMATFAEAKIRYPVLAPIDSPASALLSFRLTGRKSPSANEEMIRALICEQQMHPHALWISLLACLYAPMLRRLRGRLDAPGTEANELDQIVLSGFLRSIAAFPLPYSLGHTALFLRQMTERVVFGHLKSQRVTLRLFVPTSPEELDDSVCASPGERVFTGPLPRDHRREADALTELLQDAAGLGFSRRQLHLVAETVIRCEPLEKYVRRHHPTLAGQDFARAYERLKRQRTRIISRLQRPLYKLPGHNGSRNNLAAGADPRRPHERLQKPRERNEHAKGPESMSDAWERARSLAEKHAQAGGIFVRLANNGDKVVGAFCGDPNTREVVWLGDHYEIFDADKHKDKKPSLRVSINFYVPSEGKMKVIEGGTQWFKDVLKVREKYGLDTWLFEIERHGEAGDTKTKYSLLPETKIDADLRARMAPVLLHDLASIGVGDDEEDAHEPKAKAPAPAPAKGVAPVAMPTAAEAPGGIVTREVADALLARLRPLPRAEADSFVAHFGIQRIRDLRASDEAAARQYLEEVERRHGRTAPPAERDPFV